MTITIPMFIIYGLAILGALAILLLAFVGVFHLLDIYRDLDSEVK